VESSVAGRASISNDAIARGTSKSGKCSSSSSHGAGRKRKAMEYTAAQPSVDDSAKESTSTVTRDDIRACIEQDTISYDFLHGLLSEQVSTRDIASYGAAYRNKRKRDAANACRGGDRNPPKSNKSGAKKEDASGSTSAAAAAAISSVLGESEGAAAAASAACSGGKSRSTDALKLGDEETLRSAIDASMQEGNTFAMDGIVEDDEEYD
jgi:hypothetical protein